MSHTPNIGVNRFISDSSFACDELVIPRVWFIKLMASWRRYERTAYVELAHSLLRSYLCCGWTKRNLPCLEILSTREAGSIYTSGRLLWTYLNKVTSSVTKGVKLYSAHTEEHYNRKPDLSFTGLNRFYVGLGCDFASSYNPSNSNSQGHSLDAHPLHSLLPGWKLVKFLLGKTEKRWMQLQCLPNSQVT